MLQHYQVSKLKPVNEGRVSHDVKEDTDKARDAAALTSKLLILEKTSPHFSSF